jgi:hypothetical protein
MGSFMRVPMTLHRSRWSVFCYLELRMNPKDISLYLMGACIRMLDTTWVDIFADNTLSHSLLAMAQTYIYLIEWYRNTQMRVQYNK